MTDCLVMSIDWRFLCPNFIDLGQVVLILHDFKEKSYFLPQHTFSSEMKELCIFTLLSCSNILKQKQKIGLKRNMDWQTDESISKSLDHFRVSSSNCSQKDLKIQYFTTCIKNSVVDRRSVFTSKLFEIQTTCPEIMKFWYENVNQFSLEGNQVEIWDS